MTDQQTDTIDTSDKTLQTLFDAMQSFVGFLDTDGTVTFCNKAPLALANLQAKDVLNKKYWDCPWFDQLPQTQAQLQEWIQRAAAGEAIDDILQARAGDLLLWIKFKIQPIIKAGKVVTLLIEGLDFTEQHRLREESQAAQRRLQGLFDDMKAMVAILDIEGRVTLANNTPLLISGLDQADVMGQKLWSCPWFTGDSQSQDAVQEYVNQAAAGHSVQGDILINTLEGRIWLEFSVHPVFDDAGHVTQLVAEGNDPSVRRQVEEEREQALIELQAREQNLAVTLDSIGDAVITTDAQGKITRMNPVAEQLTGWTYTEAQNEALQGIFPIFNAATGEPLPSPVDKLMATGEIVHMSTHTTLRARDGRNYQISNSAAPIRDQEDRILGAILVFSDISEQYRLREQAKAAQLQLQGLFDDMQTMVGLYSPDGTTTFLNNTPLIATGFTRKDAIGKKLWDTPFFNYSADSQAHVQREMKRAAAGNATLSDIQFASLSGEKSWIALSFHPVLDDNGKVLQLVGEARDIAERKKTEDNLRASERQLKRYRDQAPLAAIEVDSERRIVGWNAAAEKMFGYSYEEAQNQSIELLLPNNTPSTEVFKTWEKLSSTEADKTLTSKFQHKDGHTFYGQSHNAPFIDESGQVVGAGAIIRDVTAERAAQRALHDSERAQREILDSMVEGVIVTNEMGTILTFNRAAENLLGYRVKDIAGQSVHQLVDQQTLEIFKHNMQCYLETGDLRHIGMGAEVQAVHKNGETFPTLLAVVELTQSADGKRRFITSFRDLSELKLQEEQLRRSQKMDALGKLTGGIAHDFNNMLGVVTGYADLLESALANEEKLAQYAHEIHRAGERGAKLTRKLLSFSQQTAISASTVDIKELIASQQHMLETSLTPRIKLVYELAEDTWPIYLDSDDLEDAIINISINAMHAIETNGQVTIHTQNTRLNTVGARLKNLPSGDYVLLSITDTGKGMDEQTKQRIFDPFYTTKGEQGTGLGLSQVYGFVERSKGAIDVTSIPGRGTQLRMYFPRDRADSDIEETDNQPTPASLGGNETILVVEDEEKLLGLCTEILSAQGYKVLPANNCSEALQLLEGNHVDLMFSDVVMPDMDGYELALIVSEKYPAIKIQMASGFSDDRQNALTDDTLHKNLLPKPYRSQALLNKIRGLLDA